MANNKLMKNFIIITIAVFLVSVYSWQVNRLEVTQSDTEYCTYGWGTIRGLDKDSEECVKWQEELFLSETKSELKKVTTIIEWCDTQEAKYQSLEEYKMCAEAVENKTRLESVIEDLK